MGRGEEKEREKGKRELGGGGDTTYYWTYLCGEGLPQARPEQGPRPPWKGCERDSPTWEREECPAETGQKKSAGCGCYSGGGRSPGVDPSDSDSASKEDVSLQPGVGSPRGEWEVKKKEVAAILETVGAGWTFLSFISTNWCSSIQDRRTESTHLLVNWLQDRPIISSLLG